MNRRSTFDPFAAGSPWSIVKFDNVVQLLANACRSTAVPAVIFEDGLTTTREQLLSSAQRFAGFLTQQTSIGDRIAVMLPNRIEYMIIFIAALLTQRILVNINPASKTHDTLHMLRNSGSVLIITSKENEELLNSIKADCHELRQILILRAPEPHGLSSYLSNWLVQPADCRATKDSEATIYYTSGTTGLPKGCILGHEWWLRICDIHLRTSPRQADYRPFCCVPFYYADSMFQLLCALHMGGTLIVTRRFSVSRFWPVVVQQRASELYLLASMPILLLKQPIHSLEQEHKLQIAFCSPVPKNLHQDLVHRFGVQFVDSYGTTESGWNVRVPWRLAGDLIGSGTMGIPLPEMQVRIVNEDGEGVAVGTVGELIVRGPGLFHGYLNDHSATSQVLIDGWYSTGDLVRRDSKGFLYFSGRKKDVVRRSAETASSAEIESVLRTHPMINDAAVVPVTDAIRGEEVKVYLLVSDIEKIGEADRRELLTYCLERLAAYKVPRYWNFQSQDFPRTPTMRVRKEELTIQQVPHKCWDRLSNSWTVSH